MKKTVFKRIWLTFALVLVVVMGAVMAVGCNKPVEEKNYKVTFYDGTKVITTKTVKEGEAIAKFEPKDVQYEKEGFKFVSWHSTADYSFPFNFDNKIEKDTSVYSKWQSAQVDTRRWLLAGESSAGGPLKSIGWNGGAVDEDDYTNIATKSATENSFSITINLYAGDQFQFSVQTDDGKWVEEGGAAIARGGQYLVANEYMASATGGLGDGQKNIVVSKSGNYTLVLTTDVIDKNFGTISVTRNGDAPEITIDRSQYAWYIYGSSKSKESNSILKDMGWGTGVSDAKPYAMIKVSDNRVDDGTGTWQMTGKFDVDDEFLFGFLKTTESGLSPEEGTMFKFPDIKKFNGNDAKFVSSGGMGNNIKVVTAGVYTFKVTVSIDNTTKMLKGEIEVIDNNEFLKSEQDWKVLANRLSIAQIKELLGLDLTQAQYDAYTSDLVGNNFGKGENVDSLTKVAAPTAGTLQYSITLDLGVGDYFYFCIPVFVDAVGSDTNWWATGGYNSTVTPVKAATLPAGITSVWTNNFACKVAGNYTFTITIAADAALSIAVTAN